MSRNANRRYDRTYDHTVKFSKSTWHYMRENMNRLSANQMATIDYKDENYDFIKDMDEAYNLICQRQSDIHKITVEVRDEDEYIRVSFTDADKKGQKTLNVSARFNDKNTMYAYQEFLEGIYYSPQIFHGGYDYAVGLSFVFIFTALKTIYDFSLIEMLMYTIVSGIIMYLFIARFGEKARNYVYPKNGIQFWLDKYDEQEFKRINRKAKIKVAAIFIVGLLTSFVLVAVL